jgi:hypothetical protein
MNRRRDTAEFQPLTFFEQVSFDKLEESGSPVGTVQELDQSTVQQSSTSAPWLLVAF